MEMRMYNLYNVVQSIKLLGTPNSIVIRRDSIRVKFNTDFDQIYDITEIPEEKKELAQAVFRQALTRCSTRRE